MEIEAEKKIEDPETPIKLGEVEDQPLPTDWQFLRCARVGASVDKQGPGLHAEDELTELTKKRIGTPRDENQTQQQ